MSTLSLHDALLSRGKTLLPYQPATARRCLERVIASGDTAKVVEAHTLLAELHMALMQTRPAQRHLRAALQLDRKNAKLHYRLALALEADLDADPKRAWKAMRRALRFNRSEPRYWAAYGQLALRLQRPKTALRAFRTACSHAMLAADVLAEVVDGLNILGRDEEALARVTLARFERPHDAGVQRVWEELQTATLCADENNILPFPPARIAETQAPVRRDRRSTGKPHFLRIGRVRS